MSSFSAALAERSPYRELAEEELWKAFLASADQSARESLVLRYAPYARALAARTYAKRFNDEVSFDDYLQYAMIGLLESVDRFSADRGATFKTYATTRILGSILNGLERITEKQQQISAGRRIRLQRERTESLLEEFDAGSRDEIAFLRRVGDLGFGVALGILLDGSGMVETANPCMEVGYFQHAEIRQLRERLRELVAQLPEGERRVIAYHYFQGIQFEEIATLLSLSKGRISQIHKRALQRLQERMQAVRASHRAW